MRLVAAAIALMTSAMAAQAQVANFTTFPYNLDPISPLVEYTPRPSLKAPLNTTWQILDDHNHIGFTLNTSLVGASMSFGFSGIGVSFSGALVNGTLDVLVDGVPASQVGSVSMSQGTMGPHSLYVRVDELANAYHNLTIVLQSGEIGISRISCTPRQMENYVYEQWKQHDISAYMFETNGTGQTLDFTDGDWTQPSEYLPFAIGRTPSSRVIISVPKNSSSIQLEGWTNGTYNVSVSPAPPLGPADRAFTVDRFEGYQGSVQYYDGLLYYADLDPEMVYTVILEFMGNSTEVMGFTGGSFRSYDFDRAKKADPNKLFAEAKLGIGLGIGVFIVLACCGLYCWSRRRQKRKAWQHRQQEELALNPVTRPTPPTLAQAMPTVPASIPETIGLKDDSDGLCIVCQDADATLAVVECGHLCLCSNCSRRVLAMTPRKCPLCSTLIVKNPIRIYRP